MNAEHYRSEMTLSGVSDMGEDIGFQALESHRDGHRCLHATEGAGPRPSPIGDGSGGGHVAAVSPGGHALAQPAGDHRKGQRSTLCRHLEQWARIGLLAQVHAVLVGMLRGDPTLILDTCSLRAKRGGDLTGPNPTDRSKRGTKYHIATTGDGVPVACAATAANVNDTLVFERLFLAAFAVMARLQTVFADKGYDAEPHRDLCRKFGAKPCIHKRGQPHGSGLGQRRWPVERSNAWVLENKRLALRYDRLGVIIQSLLQAACIFLVAGRVPGEL
jgi:transposase